LDSVEIRKHNAKNQSNFEKNNFAMKSLSLFLLGCVVSVIGFAQDQKSLNSWTRPSTNAVVFPNPTPVGQDAFLEADWDVADWVTFWITNSRGETEQGIGQVQEGGRIRVRGQQRPAGIYTIRWKNANGFWRQVRWVIG
jgi:hypothetical protein